MAKTQIDYNKSGQSNKAKKYNKHQLLRKLNNISKKELTQLSNGLYDDEAKYDENMIDKANDLLTMLDDASIDYQLVARNDGGGILARTKGLAGNRIVITVANKDILKYNKVKKEYQMRSAEGLVGNISANGYSYYMDSKSELHKAIFKYIKENNIERGTDEWRQTWKRFYNDDRYNDYKENSMTYMIKGLTGQLPVQPVYNYGNRRSDVSYDHSYTILDDFKRPIVKFYRRKEKSESKDNNLPFVEHYFEMKNDGVENLESTPLKQMVSDTNELINDLKDENEVVTREVKGIEESGSYNPIELSNEKLSGLNLDTLLAFHNRSDIAKAIGYEMRENPEFDLNNSEILGEPGLKDLLMEETAGIDAQIVQPEDLGETVYQKQRYKEISEHTKSLLENQGLKDVSVNYDSDHVIHWTGKGKQYNKSANQIVDIERKGEIGQIFVPDENGLVKTKFKTLDGAEDRNYNMVMGYVGYYKSNAKDTTMRPETINIKDSEGNIYEVVATRDSRNQLVPYQTPKGTYVRPERLPEEKLSEFNRKVDIYNTQHPEKPIQKIATKEVQRTLRDRLRFKGYNQSLNQQLESLVSRQALQEADYSIDNTSLNKLYHGDVYGIRISEANKDKENIVKTYQNRIKFDKSVLDLSVSELDASFDGDNDDEYTGEDASYRFNIRELDGIFDRSLSSDGANLGLIRYFNKGNQVLNTGEVVQNKDGVVGSALIKDDLPYTEGDPGDRSMMAGNQYMKARNVGQANVTYITYKGYTFEDGSVISEKFAREQGAIVNGYDSEGNPIPLEIGDKISDLHGNKSTISYIASEQDDVFKENPNLDVIMNPHSVPSRLNTGLVLEMQNSGQEQEIYHNGERIASSAPLNIVITDITARDKTKTYSDEYDENGELIEKSVRQGRLFGNQLAWVANGLGLDQTMKEVYGKNTKSFEKLKSYLNVTGLDMDEDTTILLSNGFNNGKDKPPEFIQEVKIKEDGIDLPQEGGYMELPIEVELPSGMKTRYINVLPEKYRRTQELYDGDRMYHEYSTAYSKIAQSALVYDAIEEKYRVKLQNQFNDLEAQDLSQLDLNDEQQMQRLRDSLTNKKDIQEFDKHIKNLNNDYDKQAKRLQSSVDSLTSRIIDEKLGGRSKLMERQDQYGDMHLSRSKNNQAVKQSLIKREIMSKQVPNSVTSVVTASPNVDINTIKVSSDIYDKLNLVNKNDRVLLWRDPALHDGSMRSFKIEKDDNIVGVGINPLVTESFGMDFDGDTVGVYAPRTREAQQEIAEKASIENNLLDQTSKEFSGNIGMDFVSSAYKLGYVRDNNNEIMQGPLKGRENEIKNSDGDFMSPKDQLQLVLNEMAHQENGSEKINQLWQDIVVSDKNIASSRIEFSDRESFKDSLMHMARIGAKGKPDNIMDSKIENNMKAFENEFQRPITYLERMQNPEKYLSEQSTVMDYYDRGKEMHEHKSQFNNDKNNDHHEAYEQLYKPYRTITLENGEEKVVRNKGSLGYDQDKTRMAQAGKTDLTGLAGAKSQTLVSLMYDKPDGAIAAMEVTEPLTQATLKLKHDPKKTPEIKKLLTDFDDMLNKGGYTQEQFTQDFKEMYENVGLDVRDEHLHEVFNTLSSQDGDGVTRTQPVQEVIEKKMPPLLKTSLYGYDAMKENATGVEKTSQVDKFQYIDRVLDDNGKWQDKDTRDNTQYNYGNMKTLKDISLGQENGKERLRTFNSGDKTSLHIPDRLNEVTLSSRQKIATQFAKENELGIYKESTQEITKDNAQHELNTSDRKNNQINHPKVQNINAKQEDFKSMHNTEAKKASGFDLEM